MISKENIKYSLKHLKKKKTRSLLTLVSVFIGITTIFIFISFGLGLYDYVNIFYTTESIADKVLIMPKGVGIPGIDETFLLTEDDLTAVERTPGVYETDGISYSVAEIQQGDTKKFVFIIGYDSEKSMIFEYFNVKIEKGRELRKDDRDKVLLGYNYLIDNKIFPHGLDINDRIRVQGKDLTVVGFLESIGSPPDDSQIYVTNDYFKELFSETKDYETGCYAMIIARVDIQNIDKVVENIEKSLRKSRNLEKGKEDFSVSSFGDYLETYMSIIDLIVGFVILIALISILVSAINTANTMVTSVLERTKEIGVMKSIGAKNSEIFKIFIFESSFLGFVAGILGVVLGWILTFIAGNIFVELGWGFLQPHYSIELFLGCIFFATITGAISGVAPAINASKINPIDALHYE